MANAERLRVLFVEDVQALQISYERFFRPRFEMNFAGTGADAMAQLESGAPDVLVLDMRLPDTDGIELLRKIRSVHPDLPVIITTAYLSIEPQLQVLDLGYSGYVVKPFDLDDLGSAIDAAG
jgi:CheY-like chemotaxis protein